MLRQYQVHVEADGLDDGESYLVSGPERAAEAHAARDDEWRPGDGDSCEYFVQEFKRPETRRVVKVTCSIRCEFSARVQKGGR